jgi:L-rhamnose isomerase/sugar isomerase
MSEIVAAGAHLADSGVNFMLDQCHNIEDKIPGQILSVLNVEQALARALLVDADALAATQQSGDVLGAHALLVDAFDTDVRPLLADRREARGLPRDPIAAFKASGYAERVSAERVGGVQASWGA